MGAHFAPRDPSQDHGGETPAVAGAPRPPQPRAGAPVPPRARDAQADDVTQGPLDALRNVAFAEGDANVAAVDAVGPGPHRASPLGMVLDGFKVVLVLAIAFAGLIIGEVSEGDAAAEEGLFLAPVAIAALSIGAMLVIMLAAFIISWYTHTWELAPDAFVLRSGLVVRNARRIPYQRVHSVDLSSSVLQRIFGLTTLTVDTGASEAGQGNRIQNIRRSDAEALKRALFARKTLLSKEEAARTGVVERAGATPGPAVASAPAPDAASADVDYEMELSHRLHLLGSLTDFNLGAALLAVVVFFGGVLQFAGSFVEPLLERYLEQLIYGVLDGMDGVLSLDLAAFLPYALTMALLSFLGIVVVTWVISAVLAFIRYGGFVLRGVLSLDLAAFLPYALTMALLSFLGIVVVTWVISAVLAFIRYGGFVLRRRGSRIEVSSGLLSRTTRAVDLSRVQSVSVDQSPLRRPIGYAKVSVSLVAAGGQDANADRATVVLHPCLPCGELEAFLAEVLPAFAPAAAVADPDEGLERLPGAALRRTLLHGVYWTALFAACLGLATWVASDSLAEEPRLFAALNILFAFAWACLGLGVAAMFVVRVLAWRIRRIGTRGSTLVLVDGGVSRVVSYTERPKVQSLSRRVTPFQAHARVATVSCRTACVSAEHDPRMRDVAASTAERLMVWVRPHYDNAAEAEEALRAAGVLAYDGGNRAERG